MYAKVTSLGVTGLAGYIVQVEADLSGGLPQFNLVGLPDSAVKESSEHHGRAGQAARPRQ